MAAGAVVRVLLVDDDEGVRLSTARGLELEGFEVDLAADGNEAIDRFDPDQHDVVIVDLVMPKATGMTVLQAVRAGGATAVIVVSGHGDEVHRVVALEMGADDFVAKPINVRELALRVRNTLGRRRPAEEELLSFGELEIWPGRREVRVGGRKVDLTAMEFELLHQMAQARGEVLTRAVLLQRVWGSNIGWQSPSTVTEHMHRLRRKVEPDPSAPRWLHTVRGAGYRFSG